ncbi:hypothetical protein FXN63_14215 [Pigmentiphaga aceris]|uniref:Lipoprotein n=1 Tax=Pigmentiphaga aceris TaxID=1940612 RepID=A0A5C0B148_9BURK|nr:DUF6694 family lipoprotein [Pigmentiphaga aceris]QEI06860.1 hypothetical protein FXN63_14215 [Pigmentiphaga aceris]
MKNRAARILSLLFVFMLSACTETRLDGSSDASLRSSVAKMRGSISADKRAQFDHALLSIGFGSINLKLLDKVGTPEAANIGLSPSVLLALDGKNVAEVLATAEEITARRKEVEKIIGLDNISRLQQKKERHEAALAQLALFEVSKASFKLLPQRYGRPKPLIEMTVTNRTNHAISRAYFEGTVKSPGRSVPWIKEEFNYSIPGGLEPGETVSWSLAPNEYGPWGKTEVPADAIMTVTTTQLDGPDNKTIAASSDITSLKVFTSEDELQLNQLRRKFEVDAKQ